MHFRGATKLHANAVRSVHVRGAIAELAPYGRQDYHSLSKSFWMEHMHKRSTPPLIAWLLIAIAMTAASNATHAQQPLSKVGSCPSGYHTSGNYCTPSSPNAKPAIAKVGSCPSGYHTSGNYCLASSNSAKPAVIKSGSCPSGYHTSGAYCLRN